MGHRCLYTIVLAAAAVALALLACLSADLEGVGGSARRLSSSSSKLQDPKTVAPRAGVGPWTEEEHALFLRGVEEHRHKAWNSRRWWRKIHRQFLPARSADEVEEHWREYVASRHDPEHLPSPDRGGAARIRVVSWNVACGMYATPEQIAEALRPLDPDVVLLCEAPRANPGEEVEDWSHRLAKALGLPHVHVGTQSSMGHKAPDWVDATGRYGGKFKSVLSKTPLFNGRDVMVDGSGWRHASAGAVRVETKIDGIKFALYSLHLPGYSHHRRKPSVATYWEKSTHKDLTNHINAEDASYNVVVGGDFNEWGDGLVMPHFLKATGLEDTVTERSIDHLLYSTKGSVKLVEADREWGPKNIDNMNAKTEGYLSDHPFVWCELEIPTPTNDSPFANEPGALDPEDLEK